MTCKCVQIHVSTVTGSQKPKGRLCCLLLIVSGQCCRQARLAAVNTHTLRQRESTRDEQSMANTGTEKLHRRQCMLYNRMAHDVLAVLSFVHTVLRCTNTPATLRFSAFVASLLMQVHCILYCSVISVPHSALCIVNSIMPQIWKATTILSQDSQDGVMAVPLPQLCS